MRKRLLLIDEDADFRRLGRRTLQDGGYEVVGSAGDACSALSLVRHLCPEVVLAEVYLPDATGFEVAARLARERPDTAVILTSTYSRRDFEGLARAAGARGFVPKDEVSAAELDRMLA
jgi:two-component system response regulator EvgA